MRPTIHHSMRPGVAAAERNSVLNAIVDHRYLAPQKLVADERWQREMALAAEMALRVRSDAPSVRRRP